jgi:hypothetical protein
MLVTLPALLALGETRAQGGGDTIFAGQSSWLAIVPFDGVSYEWSLYNDPDGVNFATDPGNCPPAEAYFIGGVNTGDSVEVMWMEPGTYFFKVMATDSCSNNVKVGKMEVLESISYASFREPEPVCSGDTAWLTLDITGGIGPWDITYTDGTDTWTIYDIEESPHTFQHIPTPTVPGTYQYWVIFVTSGTGMINPEPSEKVTLIVKPKPVTSPIQRY